MRLPGQDMGDVGKDQDGVLGCGSGVQSRGWDRAKNSGLGKTGQVSHSLTSTRPNMGPETSQGTTLLSLPSHRTSGSKLPPVQGGWPLPSNWSWDGRLPHPAPSLTHRVALDHLAFGVLDHHHQLGMEGDDQHGPLLHHLAHGQLWGEPTGWVDLTEQSLVTSLLLPLDVETLLPGMLPGGGPSTSTSQLITVEGP